MSYLWILLFFCIVILVLACVLVGKLMLLSISFFVNANVIRIDTLLPRLMYHVYMAGNGRSINRCGCCMY